MSQDALNHSGVLELELFVRFGMSPSEAILASTKRAAEALGMSQVGTIERPNFANGLQIEYTHHATRLLSPTTAITHGSQVMTSATPPLKGHQIMTWVKVGNDWVIAALQVAWFTSPQ